MGKLISIGCVLCTKTYKETTETLDNLQVGDCPTFVPKLSERWLSIFYYTCSGCEIKYKIVYGAV